MRPLFEIIEEVQGGGKPDYEELRFALLTYHSLLFFSNKDVEKLYKDEVSQFMKDFVRNENFRRHKTALNQDPMIWIGSSNPDLPEYQAQRRMYQKIFDNAMKKAEKMEAK